MPGFLYFAPGHKLIDAAAARSLGLAYAFEGRAVHGRDCLAGPGDAGPGFLFADREHVPASALKLDVDRQRWVRWQPAAQDEPAAGGLRVGVWDHELPGPADLQREQLLPGTLVEALDGSRWLAPVARRWLEHEGQLRSNCELPLRRARNDEGIWVATAVQPRYERLWSLAMAYEEALYVAAAAADHHGNFTFSFPQIDRLTVLALQVNYRLDEAEWDLLGLHDDRIRSAIVDVLIDRLRGEQLVGAQLLRQAGDSDDAAEDVKKKDSGGKASSATPISPGTPGPKPSSTASPAGTGPPSPT